MPKGEFENRDRDENSDLSNIPLSGSLGELPEDLSNERGDLASYALRAAENMSPDMARAQAGRVDAAQTGVGSPAIDYSVRSIFDSRPSNHREFNIWFGRSVDEGGDLNLMTWARRAFQVPTGYVAVLRAVTVIVPPSFTPSNFDGTLEFCVDGTTIDPMQVPPGPASTGGTPEQMSIPWRSNAPVSTFVIADQNSFLGIGLTLVDATTLTADQLQVGFYGQFLLKTGVPAQFQPANEAGRAKFAVTTGKNDLALLSSEGVTLTRRKKVPFPDVPILRK